MSQPSHPIQPLAKDERGTMRFKENAIVRHLLDKGGIDLNALAMLDFPKEDWQQLAQLIGYSLGGYGELSYVTDDAYGAAARMACEGLSEEKARIAHLEEEIAALREALLAPIARLYGKHPADLLGSG